MALRRTTGKQQLIRTDSNLVLVAFTMISIGCVLELIGYCTPGWYNVRHASFRTGQYVSVLHHGGLWYDVDCEEDASCTVHLKPDNRLIPEEFVEEVTEWWLEYQVEATVALGFSIVALIYSIVHRKSNCSPTKQWIQVNNLATFICCLVSGIVALVASGRIADAILDDYETSSDNPVIFPYSCFIFGLGGVLLCIATLLTFVVIVRYPLNIQPNGIKERVGMAISNDNMGKMSGNACVVVCKQEREISAANHTEGVISGTELAPNTIASSECITRESGGISNITYTAHSDQRLATKPQQDKAATVVNSGNFTPHRPTHQEVEIIQHGEGTRAHQQVINNIPNHHQRLVYAPSSSMYIHQPSARQYYAECQHQYHNAPVQRQVSAGFNGHRQSTKQVDILGAL